MTKIAFQLKIVKDEKTSDNAKHQLKAIINTLLYIQGNFEKIMKDAEDVKDYYTADVVIACNSDCVMTPDGEKGFGAFDTESNTIYIAADLPDEDGVIETTAHELAHYIQKIKGLEYSEEYAERFALGVKREVKRINEEVRAQTEDTQIRKPIGTPMNPWSYLQSRKKRKKYVRGK